MPQTLYGQSTVYVVDDDEGVRASLCYLLSKAGWQVQTFANIESFQKSFDPNRIGCCIFDLRIGEENGIDLAHYLNSLNSIQPFIFLTGFGTIAVAVESMKLGASHFLEKPVDSTKLLTLVQEAVVTSSQSANQRVLRFDLIERRNSLSVREREVMNLLIEGMLSKQIAAKLGISCKTVEVHKTNLKRKLGVRSTVELLKYRD